MADISDIQAAETVKIVGSDATGVEQTPVRSTANGDLSVQFRNGYTRIAGNSTIVVKSGAGILHGILINANTTGGTITIYDNTAASGTIIAVLHVGTPSGGLLSTSGQPGPNFLGPLGLSFTTGLTVVTAGSNSNDVTFIFQ